LTINCLVWCAQAAWAWARADSGVPIQREGGRRPRGRRFGGRGWRRIGRQGGGGGGEEHEQEQEQRVVVDARHEREAEDFVSRLMADLEGAGGGMLFASGREGGAPGRERGSEQASVVGGGQDARPKRKKKRQVEGGRAGGGRAGSQRSGGSTRS